MIFDRRTNSIEIYKGDYGTGIIFSITGLNAGDSVAIIFEKFISTKEFISDKEDIKFSLMLTKEDIDSIPNHEYTMPIPYSIKIFRDGEFIETVMNGVLKIKGGIVIE